MRLGLALALSALLSTQALAAPVVIPTGARWLVTVPSAGRFAREMSMFLTSASGLAPALSAHHLNAEVTSSLGVSLLDAGMLSASGVDIAQPWTVFERGGAQYLVVGVKDRATLAATLDAWAVTRSLPHREETKVDRPHGAVAVTFSRARGSRAAAGYLIAGDRAVIMEHPLERAAALAAAYQAVDGGAPVDPSVDGTLLVWLGNETALHDGWVGIVARNDGIDVVGEARHIEPGFAAKEPNRSAWIRELTGSGQSSGEVPMWMRVAAGPKTGAQMIDVLMPLLRASLAGPGSKPWLQRLRDSATGAIEIVASAVDVQAVEAARSGGPREDTLRLMHPSVLLSDRTGAEADAVIDAALPALCNSAKVGDHAVRAGCVDPGLTVGRGNEGLFFGWTGSVARHPTPPTPAGETLSCPRGIPIASARFDAAVIASRLDQVGLMEAMTSQALAGLLALNTEYGRLMRASKPATGIACLESSGRVTLHGSWRFGD